MLEKMKSAWRIPELRKKITYTFVMLLVYPCSASSRFRA